MTYLTSPVKSNKGRTPARSHHPSRPSFDRLADEIEPKLKEPPQNHQTAKTRALEGDNFQCTITKQSDFGAILNDTELETMVMREGDEGVFTQCAHIFPKSTNANIIPGSNKAKYAASFWTAFDRFGYSTLREELNGSNIHRLENIVTMEVSLHSRFDRL